MKRVLVVDDASYMRLMLKKILENNGFEIIGEAAGKTDAIRKYKELKPDIVTLDLNLSGLVRDGIDVLAMLMEIDPEAFVVIISAAGQVDLIDECARLGAKRFLLKPIETAALLEALEEY